jgi:hypothetical protein
MVVGTIALAIGAAAVTAADAYTAEPEEWAVCGSERIATLAVVENLLRPTNGSTVAGASGITFSSESPQPLHFAIASSPERLGSPDIDSGPGQPSSGSGGTQRYSFVSTNATATPRTVYWEASFSTEGLAHCAHQSAQTVTTAVRTLIVLAPSSSESEAAAKESHEEAEKRRQEEIAASDTLHQVTGSVSLNAVTVFVRHAREANVILTCAGPAICRGRLTLTVKHTPGTANHRHTKTDAIGTAAFSIPAGKTAHIALQLSTAGRTLLRASHGRLGANLTILKSSPGPSQAHTETVRLEQKHS